MKSLEMKNKNILLGVSGGIAAYKSCELVRTLVKAGANIDCILTKAGGQFITPLTLQTLSGNPVHTDIFHLTEETDVRHISLADKADLILVAPATANIIAKVACGLCNDLLTTVICATKAPVLFAPSMNVNMWENPITQDNIEKLKKYGYHFIEPGEGMLACGYEGKGRLAEINTIANTAKSILE
ncbi:MAG: bifunctional phosphopantothenoylcysteine decarboxylase/phosphopantothenate--cysteine ligase CoaBC [Deltaproteobacteria bacterium]|jgi:phosphopantothenoylcysteine decarboxylase / phosphopantothenate---cysteine ligase|nr:bifunctional phosphopantothenoylcysteine decarboxylase/phosphopantothenate--cysteine ligase CoaBC [Deltaproteobacteria bacterium]